jgi:hypothetical protein
LFFVVILNGMKDPCIFYRGVIPEELLQPEKPLSSPKDANPRVNPAHLRGV